MPRMPAPAREKAIGIPKISSNSNEINGRATIILTDPFESFYE
jgi:hypothetical protein